MYAEMSPMRASKLSARSTRLTGKTSSVLFSSWVWILISLSANMSPVRNRNCRESPR